MTVEEHYNHLMEHYRLPKFRELDRFFQISTIDEEDGFLLSSIRKKIQDKLHRYSEILENIISPDHSFITLIESKAFTEDEKLDILEHFKMIQVIIHDSELAGIEFSEEKEAEFLSTTMQAWPALSDEIKKIIEKLRSSWTSKSSFSEEISYFG